MGLSPLGALALGSLAVSFGVIPVIGPILAVPGVREVLVARRDDAWLATWSLADAVVPLPIDAPELTAAAAELLRGREAARPVRRAVG